MNPRIRASLFLRGGLKGIDARQENRAACVVAPDAEFCIGIKGPENSMGVASILPLSKKSGLEGAVNKAPTTFVEKY